MIFCSRARDGDVLLSARNARPSPWFAANFFDSSSRKPSASSRETVFAVELREPFGAVGIVKIQDGSLRVTVGAAVAAGEFGVALQFDGPAFVGFGHQRDRAGARRHGRRIIFRFAIDVIFRLLAERLQFFLRPAAARAHHAQARQRERRGHDLDEVPAGNTVLELARALRKFAMQPLLELRRVRQFIQAAPVTAARGQVGTGVGGLGFILRNDGRKSRALRLPIGGCRYRLWSRARAKRIADAQGVRRRPARQHSISCKS